MLRWVSNWTLKIGLASAVIWFAVAAYEMGFGRALHRVSDLVTASVETAEAMIWTAWPLVLTAAALALIGMVIYDTATRD